MGRTEGPDHGPGAETASAKTARGASRPTTASTTSSRRPIGCRGPTTSGWANRCSATPSPGTSTPTRLRPASQRTASPPVEPERRSRSATCRGRSIVAQGERLATRQEIDWPFQLGVVKVVPYALGEAGPLGRGHQRQPLDRLFGQAGVRASMPMWSGRSHVLQRLAERSRHRPQGRLRRRVLGRRRQPPPDRPAAVRSAGRRFGRGIPPQFLPPARSAGRRTIPPSVAGDLRRSSTSGSTPCGPACRAGSPRRAPKSPTT